MSKAIEDLKNEHNAIISGLQILGKMVIRLERNSEAAEVSGKDILSFLGFLKEFADKCHHGKEEGILFSSLIKAGMPEKGGPIEIILAEHARERMFIKEMEDTASSKPGFPGFIATAKNYMHLHRNHIQKENNVLFPSAEKILIDSQLTRIYELFVELEEKVIGQGRHEEFREMLDSLRAKYHRKEE